MRAAIYDLLSNDSTLMGVLTGGLYDAADVEGGEISRQGTPDAFDDNGEVLPCALLRLTGLAPAGPSWHSARLSFSLLFYQRSGYDSIDAARARAYALLHKERVSPGSGGCWEIDHSDDVMDVRDEALRCSLAISRYVAMVRRG